ncbi:GNAT family N-acetyltransferase [Dermacoccus nishinomiyaensis]
MGDSEAYEPYFALVACGKEALFGYAVPTWGDLDGAPALGVGPIAVDPGIQGHGVGAALIEELFRRAKRRGEWVVVLLGEPAYYSSFGFAPASRFGIVAHPTWGDFFQACALGDEAEVPSGTYTYAEPFASLG